MLPWPDDIICNLILKCSTPRFYPQPWRNINFLHGCKRKSGHGRPGYEVNYMYKPLYQYTDKQIYLWLVILAEVNTGVQ